MFAGRREAPSRHASALPDQVRQGRCLVLGYPKFYLFGKFSLNRLNIYSGGLNI
jgi:hypothetical protein